MLVPIIFLVVALALETLSSFGRRRLPDQRWAVGVGAAAVLVGGVLAVVNVRSYFDWMESDYALADRQPGVWAYEFEEWSSFQRKAGEQGAIGFNAGTWRERQDRAGCLTGRVDGNLCADLPVDASPDPLGRTLVQPAEVPVELTQRTLAEIDAEEFRLLHGGYSDLLMQTLQTIQIEEAWVTTFAAEGVGVTASVARLASEDQANLAFLRKSTLTGQDYLGGPEAEQLPAPPLGDVALLVHFRLSDREWWEYFWKDGTYVANVQALYLPASPDAQPLPMLEAAARAQAGRLAALVGAR